ncbi:putative RNA exonuclease NGL3 [Wickerhamomyces ciferrii]|uniref:RNA exonuclease NGL3 n=1 Tax=Wickerhamomyces ciferrii (strain ATCC 14091 / BCRC 22168 / CBS 111 / JCM 3599 / NBRC 0793 / NRRL Y-1031 F-60-10) TaxID=1206466 RepID=K0KKU2_WICCF|nr:putative RNA exonuclease NGL3 [Wickerhamomyces ciferrii]CCH41733.1 putative RNA exonuclease NGL3 [Wickerhamomyces ciferrii]
MSEAANNPPAPKPKASKKKKGSKNPVDITPEYIAEQRAKREAAKKAKRDELIAQGIDPDQVDTPADLRFISRPMLKIPRDENDKPRGRKGVNVKIMTYNVLAQALIRRKLFPTSGNAVKWFKRSQVLLSEFKHYNSDILLLQEVDHVQYNSFWKSEFEKLGYNSVFNRFGDKNHGVAIFFRENMFDVTDKMFINYDIEKSGEIQPRTITRNVGLILALKFKDRILEQFPETDKKGILVGTTHLFWHPFGTYERTRQTYLILKKFQEFIHRVQVLQRGSWFRFFGGDFNAQPYDAPYLSITSKPIKYDNRCKKVIECSTSFQYSKLREGIEDEDEEGGNIEKFGENQPKDPVPESFTPTEEQAQIVRDMEDLHNSLPMRAISLYSVGYKLVHPENSGLDNEKDEPEISNWAHAWRGLLDYIFYIAEWDLESDSQVKSLAEFEELSQVRINSLLRMPPGKEMSKHGQPHEGEYPSDHLCMIADLKLLL